MARSVDEVKRVALPRHANVLSLDRDTALALQVHRVEVLGPHVTRLHGAGHLKNAVGQGGLAVVDVSNDREIADVCEIH